MSENGEIGMIRETLRGLDRMVEQIFVGPVKYLSTLLRRNRTRPRKLIKFGLRIFYGLSSLAVLAVCVVFFASNPEWFTFAHWQDGGATTRSEVLRNVGLLGVAVFGLFFAVWRTIIASKQNSLSEQGQITDRYVKAVEMLSEPAARTRIGGVYALSRIAQDSPTRDFVPVMDTLCEFVQNPPYVELANERARYRHEFGENYDPDDDQNPAISCSDVRVAIRVIQERIDSGESPNYEASFSRASFQELDLSQTGFAYMHVTWANFSHTNLVSSVFLGADLRDANFYGARLAGAYFDSAILWHANFEQADLAAANFRKAKLQGASFASAHVRNTDFDFADLRRADLSNSVFTGANFRGALVSDAKFGPGPVKQFAVSQQQINAVYPSSPPESLPPGVEWPFEKHGDEWVRKTLAFESAKQGSVSEI